MSRNNPNREKIKERLSYEHGIKVIKCLSEHSLLDLYTNEVSDANHLSCLLPAHFSELEKVYQNVANKLQRSGISIGENDSDRRRQFEKQKLIGFLKQRLSEFDWKDGSLLDDSISKALEFLAGHYTISDGFDAQKEWDRFVALNQLSGGFHSLETVYGQIDISANDKQVIQKYFLNVHNDVSGQIFRKVTAHWERRISRHKSREHIDGITIDSHAMADLYLLNRELYKAQSALRFVLVTADRSLVKATYGGITSEQLIHGEELLGEEIREDSAEFNSQFATECVRHIWASMTDAIEEAPIEWGRENSTDEAITPDHNEHVYQLFAGFFAKFADTTDISVKDLEFIASQQHVDFGTVYENIDIDEVIIRWCDLSVDVFNTLALRETELGKENVKKIIKETIEQVLHIEKTINGHSINWDEISDVIDERISQAKDALTIDLSDAGIGALIKANQIGVEGTPDLSFSLFPSVSDIIKKISLNKYSSKKQFTQDFDNLHEFENYDNSSKAPDNRIRCYFTYLVLGAMFASADKWSVAAEHAALATDIVYRSALRSSRLVARLPRERTSDGKRKHINGREALFLSSVAKRMTANSLSDLEESEADLIRSAGFMFQDHDELRPLLKDGRNQLPFGDLELIYKSSPLRDEQLRNWAKAVQRHFALEPIMLAKVPAEHLLRYSQEFLAIALAKFYISKSEGDDSLASEFFREVMENAQVSSRAVRYVERNEGLSNYSSGAVFAAINIIQSSILAEIGHDIGWINSIPPYGHENLDCGLDIVFEYAMLPWLQRKTPGKPRLPISKLALFYVIVGCLISKNERYNKYFDWSTFEKLLPSIRSSKVTNYDHSRYGMLHEFAINRIKQDDLSSNSLSKSDDFKISESSLGLGPFY
ncbi:hypothetical protein TH19_21750 [Thalassospira profundimaris]|uniref:Uncharacterized protein n=2 Tax=Thalassospira profundimaris TaxID=502049 RepID=A0A367VYN5_9PROT|nr:hypothetical protein TH19_21750 [Thalassospira profundimaris]